MIQSLQFLRGLASVFIVFSHAHGLIRKRHEELDLNTTFWSIEQGYTKVLGGVGVDLFLVLAGFIIFYTNWGKVSTTTEFLTKRFIRIYPIWWVALLALLVLSFIPGASASYSVVEIIKSFLLYPFYLDGSIKPILEVGWTLHYIVMYYILFALLIKLDTLTILKLITAIFCSFTFVGLFIDTHIPFFEIASNPRTIAFAAGGWIAYAYKENKITWNNTYRLITYPALLILIASFIWIDVWRLDVHPLFSRTTIAALILIIALFDPFFNQIKPAKWTSFVGDASYSIYLFHMFPIMLLSGLWKRGYLLPPEGTYGVITWFAIIVCGVISGIIAYVIFERPIFKYLRKKLEKPKK